MNARLTWTLSIVTAAVLLSSCASMPGDSPAPRQNQVTYIAQGMSFIGPDTVPAGWTTFRLDNQSPMVHFAVIERLPDGYHVADQQREVAPPFQEGMNLLNAGDKDGAMKAFGKLPQWFGDVVFMGGPGFVSPGHTAATTVYLEPGTYILECYVKTGGIFHSFSPDPSTLAMVHEFTVTASGNDTAPPQADATITVSSESGYRIEGTLEAGPQTIAVRFADQKVYEHFLRHDVHLAKLGSDAGTDELAGWMDWMQREGLESPAPVIFVGGIHEMPAGSVGYFSVDVAPGNYALVAEVPDPASHGMLMTFAVE